MSERKTDERVAKKDKMFYGGSRVGKTMPTTACICDLCHKDELLAYNGYHWLCETCTEIVENVEKIKQDTLAENKPDD
jgi:hypothetical protein